MARPKKDASVDLAVTHELSEGLIQRLACPAGATKAFLRDREVSGLRVRVTANGAKAFVYEAKLNGKAISRTLGRFPLTSIAEAKAKARDLARTVKNDKLDPRELDRQQAAVQAAQQNQQTANAVTVTSAWSRYTMEGSPKRRDDWKPRYVADMAKMVALGGKEKLRGQGLTLPGHLAPLMGWRLSDVTEDALTAWFKLESRRSKHQATRALMMFRGFLRWCSTEPALRGLVNREAGKAPAIMDNLPEAKRRTDALEAAQVPGWWLGAIQLSNLTASAYLRALVLTGARREEMAALKWSDVDFRWQKLTIADKVGDTRTIPLTAYLSRMLATLPRGKGADGLPSPFVFASASKSGRLADPRSSHEKVLLSAGVDGLTLHGLRRSFSLLGEAAGAPAGAIAQVMGHRPSATAEGYRPRSVDALRPFLQLIEDYILALAGVEFDATAIGSDGLRLVAAA
jgi:integrase